MTVETREKGIGTVPDALRQLFRGARHPQRARCPACGEDLNRTALIRIAYVFTGCDCNLVPYGHLYEQLWHLDHLREASKASQDAR